jgi:NAD(P)H-dependent flavin oxidoreductase YrpB (nitropropane dioxygenase family)
MNATDTETISLNFPDFSVRLWKNKRAVELAVDPKVQDLPWKMGPEVIQEGDTERILLGAGQIVGLVKTCISVQKTIDSIISEWKMTVKKLQNLTSFE